MEVLSNISLSLHLKKTTFSKQQFTLMLIQAQIKDLKMKGSVDPKKG